jgi:hypothetical protein
MERKNISSYQQDVFLSHASPDKEKYIYPLADALTAKDVTFWLDDANISWGDSVVGKINTGLRSSQFAVICLSKNFLQRPWPEAELGAVLSIQNDLNIKRALPLILNSKTEVLSAYPLISGLAYREYSEGPEILAEEISKLVGHKQKSSDELLITVEGVHTGKLCRVRTPGRASIEWLSSKGQSGLGVYESLKTGPYGEFRVRWILVDVDAEKQWRSMSRQQKREIQALISTGNDIRVSFSEYDRLSDLGVRDNSTFHLYAIEDERFDPPPACAP